MKLKTLTLTATIVAGMFTSAHAYDPKATIADLRSTTTTGIVHAAASSPR